MHNKQYIYIYNDQITSYNFYPNVIVIGKLLSQNLNI